MCQESRNDLVGYLWLSISQRVAIKSWSHLKDCLEANPLPSSLLWFLVGFRTLLAVGWRPLFFATCAFPFGSSLHGSWLHPDWEREGSPSRKSQYFCDLTSEVRSDHFCCSLLFTIEFKSSPHSRGGDYTRAWRAEGRNHWGPSSRVPTILPTNL